jgi:phage shock protein A
VSDALDRALERLAAPVGESSDPPAALRDAIARDLRPTRPQPLAPRGVVAVLARAALVEKKKAGDMADQLKAEIAVLDDALRAYEEDIAKLQHRLREARSRQTAIAARLESAENRVKLRTLMSTERTDEALARFDQLERRVDYAEGRADALQIAEGKTPSLADEIAALAGSDAIDDELAAMKKALGKTDLSKGE